MKTTTPKHQKPNRAVEKMLFALQVQGAPISELYAVVEEMFAAGRLSAFQMRGLESQLEYIESRRG